MMAGFRPRMGGQEDHRRYATDEIAACAWRIGAARFTSLNLFNTAGPGESADRGGAGGAGGPGGGGDESR